MVTVLARPPILAGLSNLLDDRARRMPGLDRNANHAAAARLDDVAADDGVFGPVGALDEDVGLDRGDELVRRLLVEDDDGIDRASAARTSARSASALMGRPSPLLDRTDRSELTPTISASPSERARVR